MPNACYTVRDFNAGKTGATIERIVSNACYTVYFTTVCNVTGNYNTPSISVGIRTVSPSLVSYRNFTISIIDNIVINTINLKIVGIDSSYAQ